MYCHWRGSEPKLVFSRFLPDFSFLKPSFHSHALMEDSAKRRERLMAFRTEASQRSGAPPPETPLGPAELPDPLFSSSPPAEAAPNRPRFDYYTNPAAAFSASHGPNKRKTSSFLSPSPPTSSPQVRTNGTSLFFVAFCCRRFVIVHRW